jgi:hypothetical protein
VFDRGNFYAPLFYDSNNTGYYVNPNGASILYGLKLVPGSSANQASGDDNVLWIHRESNNDWGVQVNADQGTATDYGFEFLGGASHTYAFSAMAAGTRYFQVGNSYSQHDSSFRAPIFYDSNNTTYYLNPADTSTSLSTAGKLHVQGGHGSARLHINYQHSATDSGNSGALTAWVSEPGITYNGAGIGGNIHASGQYYGRAYDSGYGCYVRFDKGNGNVEHWSTLPLPLSNLT